MPVHKVVRAARQAESCAYACSRNSLAGLNSFYIFLAMILIGVAAAAKSSFDFISLPIVGAIIACGVFLLLVAILGLIGAIRHSQCILFFYMIILGLLFIVQLSISIGCLAVPKSHQKVLLKTGYEAGVFNSTSFGCCGFETTSNVSCSAMKCCGTDPSCSSCVPCYLKYAEPLDHVLQVSGGVGLFFAFTLLLGIYLSIRYRRQKDPRLNVDAFL